MELKEAQRELRIIEQTVTADDNRFRSVIVQHFDGIHIQHDAFLVEKEEWLMMFGEHMQPIMWEKDQVNWWAEFDPQYPPKTPDTED